MNLLMPRPRAAALLACALLLFSSSCGDDSAADPQGDAADDASVAGDADTMTGDVDATTGDAAVDGASDDVDAADAEDTSATPALTGRHVVVSRPYDDEGAQASMYEVLAIDEAGGLSSTGVRFEMGRAGSGEISFSPDGRVGYVAQDDGTLGVFRFIEPDAPEVEVIDAAFDGGFYADAVIVEASGEGLLIPDANVVENGGGVYRVALDVEGLPGAVTHLVEASGVSDAAITPDGRLVFAGRGMPSAAPGDDAYLFEVDSQGASLVASADVFSDDDHIISDIALSEDGRHLLIADNSILRGSAHRVGVVEITGDALLVTQVLEPFNDPASVVIAPGLNAGLITALQEDAIYTLAMDPDADPPFSLAGELSYQGAGARLPGSTALARGGALEGVVFIAENTAVRVTRFTPEGDVVDQGTFSLGEGLSAICGGIGVQP